MNSLLQTQANRRQLLAGGACTLAAALAAGSASGAGQGFAKLADNVSVVLHDPRFALAVEMRQRLQSNGALILQLAADPVRMWRGELNALLQPRDTRLLGVTRWPEFLMIRGLAAESRRHVRYERMDAATGAMVWLIA